jgi:hypothetical protein
MARKRVSNEGYIWKVGGLFCINLGIQGGSDEKKPRYYCGHQNRTSSDHEENETE